MHDSRGAALKVGDRVLIEAEVIDLNGSDENFCCCGVKVVTPDQPNKEKVMSPPTFSAMSTKMFTKIGAAVACILLLAGYANAQPQQAPPIKYSLEQAPQQAPPVKYSLEQLPTVEEPAQPVKSTFPSYDDAYAASIDEGKPLVIFVGGGLRQIKGAVTVQITELNGDSTPRIVLTKDPRTTQGWKVSRSVTDDQISHTLGLEVKVVPVPFPRAGTSRQLDPRSIPRKVVRPEVEAGDGDSAGPRFNSDHNCPDCGARQLIVSGKGTIAGTHTHTCANCGLTWYH